MRSRRLSGLFLALLLAGFPALARSVPGESSRPQPSFLTRLWDQVRELLPQLEEAKAPPPPEGRESVHSEGDPDLGLGMDPDG